MPIEFRCPQCQKLLRTPDGTAGKQARCPQCAAIATIPAASLQPAFEPQPAVPERVPREPELAANPYRSPAVASTEPRPAQARSFHPTRIDFSEVLERTWTIFKANLGACVGGLLLADLCAFAAAGIAVAVALPLLDHGDDATVFITAVLLGLALALIFTMLTIGVTRYMLGIARDGRARYSDLFSPGPFLWPGAAVIALLLLGANIGFWLLLFVPGIIFAYMFCLAPWILVDQGAGVLESFRLSARAMRGNKLTAFLMVLAVGLPTVIINLVTCNIGTLFTGPFMVLLFAVIYLSATGQRTAAQPPEESAAAERMFGGESQPAT